MMRAIGACFCYAQTWDKSLEQKFNKKQQSKKKDIMTLKTMVNSIMNELSGLVISIYSVSRKPIFLPMGLLMAKVYNGSSRINR